MTVELSQQDAINYFDSRISGLHKIFRDFQENVRSQIQSIDMMVIDLHKIEIEKMKLEIDQLKQVVKYVANKKEDEQPKQERFFIDR